jgi:hypothetical protein
MWDLARGVVPNPVPANIEPSSNILDCEKRIPVRFAPRRIDRCPPFPLVRMTESPQSELLGPRAGEELKSVFAVACILPELCSPEKGRARALSFLQWFDQTCTCGPAIALSNSPEGIVAAEPAVCARVQTACPCKSRVLCVKQVRNSVK